MLKQSDMFEGDIQKYLDLIDKRLYTEDNIKCRRFVSHELKLATTTLIEEPITVESLYKLQKNYRVFMKNRKEKITLEEYQEFTPSTFIVPEYNTPSVDAYLFSGLAAEAGELVGNYAKYTRGDFNKEELRNRTFKELGDIMYFVSQLSNELGFQIEDILVENKYKLEERMKLNKIKGDGENVSDR